jgi:hypothetical protein
VSTSSAQQGDWLYRWAGIKLLFRMRSSNCKCGDLSRRTCHLFVVSERSVQWRVDLDAYPEVKTLPTSICLVSNGQEAPGAHDSNVETSDLLLAKVVK